jgi:hypothetical protein
VSLFELIRQMLRLRPQGMTPQEIREVIKADHSDYYGTKSHIRNVAKRHCKDLDHALLAQIYGASRNAQGIVVDKSQKPFRLTLAPGGGPDAMVTAKEIAAARPGMHGTSATQPIARRQVPLRPTSVLATEYLHQWNNSERLENYRLQEASLSLLFRSFCPDNTKIEHVLLKVSVLNDFYSTNIFDTYSVARHIVERDIDERLVSGDESLVNEIAQVPVRGKTKNFYSFASKYCSHHKPTSYAIFDSFVEKMLLHYKAVDSFGDFSKSDLRDYSQFMGIIVSFRGFYKLEQLSLRDIDIFLWLAGKECFPRKYG